MGNAKIPARITRRQALTTGAVSACAFLGAGSSDAAGKEETAHSMGTGRHGSGWSRGPDRDRVRDLEPGPTPVRLACSSSKTRLWYPRETSITEAVKNIRSQGYTSAGTSYRADPKNEWLTCPELDITELKKALRDYDVEFFDMMVWTNLIHPDEKTRQENLKYVAENVEAAERCGVRQVCACTGSCDPEYYIAMHPDNWTKETWKRTVDSVRQILRDTSGCTTALGMEAAVTTNLDGPVAHKRLMEDVGDPRCKVTLDATNMFSVANYYHSTEMLEMCFDMLGEDILSCHGKDTWIERDKMLALLTMKPAGQGVQDYETYLVWMSRMKWPRTLLLEFAKDEEYPAAKAFVEETAKRVGVKIYG